MSREDYFDLHNYYYEKACKMEERKMTDEQYKERLKYRISVEQAFLDGRPIQASESLDWIDDKSPTFNWDLVFYRIKPNQTIIPYSFEELCEAIKIHGNGLLLDDTVIFITSFSKNNNYSGKVAVNLSKEITDEKNFSYSVISIDALCNKHFKFLDGTIFGKIVE